MALRKSPNLSLRLLPSGAAVGVIRSYDTGEKETTCLALHAGQCCFPLATLDSRGTKGSVLPMWQHIWVPGPGYR